MPGTSDQEREKMKQNISNMERALRFLLGAGILSLVFLGPKTPLGYLGLIALVTASSGFCPLYRILGRGWIRMEK